MKKVLSMALIAVFALSFVAGAIVTPTEAASTKNCDWMCRQSYFWYCCGGPGEEPGCIIVGRCE